MTILIPLLIILVMVGLNGVFVAAEFAILGVRASRIEQLAQSGSRAAVQVRETISDNQNTNRYFATAQLGITVASLGLGMYGEPVVAGFIEGPLHDWFNLEGAAIHTVSFILSLSLITYLHVVLGEMVPKSLALQRPEGLVLVLAWPMALLERLFAWPISLLNDIGFLVLRVMGVPDPDEESRLHTSEELELIVAESYATGLVNPREQELVKNIFDFGERRVGQVMTPRTQIDAISLDIGESELLARIDASPRNRLPVYEDSIDNVVGVLHLKDLVRQQISAEAFEMKALLREVPIVPETLKVDELLADLRRRRLHLAIVIDEHGGTLGLVTLEDLVEEVVGEVRDEFDVDEEPPLMLVGPGHLEAEGTVLLEQIEDYLPLPAAAHNVQTIGGLVLAEVGLPPEVGDEARFGDVTIRVEAVDGMAIRRVSLFFPTGGRSG